MSLEEAIEILREEYAKTEYLPWVRSRIAYAMYQAWKRVDRAERKEE